MTPAMHRAIQPVTSHRSELGEGPLWSPDNQSILWLDIIKGIIHEYYPESGTYRNLEAGEMIGAIAWCANGKLIAALQSGFAFIDRENGKIQRITDPESHLTNNRFNDGKCDPAGRFWAGTMHLEERPHGGNLYRMDPDLSVHLMIPKVSVSNGLAWHADGRKFYYIDSPTRLVKAFDFNPETGDLSNPKDIIHFRETEGFPDGMTIDAENKLWIAHWGGWQVSRWDPETGKKLLQIDLPVEKVTSCVFGGAELKDLYVTTASIGLKDSELNHQPFAGHLFVWPNCGFQGRAASVFRPEFSKQSS